MDCKGEWMMACKILVTGALHGNYGAVIEKISKLHAKNSFSLAIVLGDFFADPQTASPGEEDGLSALISGNPAIPLPVYFTVCKQPLPAKVVEKLERSDNELCLNLYFLGKRSITKTSEGLRIVNLSGSIDPEVTAGLSKDKYLPFHTEDDAKSLRGANSADILISSTWPADIQKGSKVILPDEFESPVIEECVADLCSALRPRYHFSTSESAFYEREPFFHSPSDQEPDTKPITRFISLASFDNPSKQKWLYAFSIDPTSSIPITLPPGTTASPFKKMKRHRPLDDQEQSYSRFSHAQHGDHYRPHKRSRYNNNSSRRNPPPGPQDCFFCLSSTNLSTHLITSIATDSYITTAKGPLTTASTFPTLKCPFHLLIIPFEHFPTLSSIPDPTVRAATYKEMHRYRRALHSLLISKTGRKLGSVTWEISRQEGVHTHWQFLPVDAKLIQKGLVEAAFKVEAENEKYPTLFKTKEVGDGIGESADFFRVWIWAPGEEDAVEASLNHASDNDDSKVDDDATNNDDEGGLGGESRGTQKSLVLQLTPEFRFDLQFGRRVMAKLLGLEGRFNWRDCTQAVEEETKEAEAFKEVFKRFDFSLD